MEYEDFIQAAEDTAKSYEGGATAPSITPYGISSGNWDTVRSKCQVGSVFITKDSVTSSVRHGHAAIVSNKGTSSYGTNTVFTTEHRGKGITEYSDEYNTQIEADWRYNVTTFRVYNIKTSASGSVSYAKSTAAGQYARNNLQGRPYNAVALKNANAVNCATLVFQAYASQGIYLGNPNSVTVIPSDIVKDSKSSLLLSYNWSGGGNSW